MDKSITSLLSQSVNTSWLSRWMAVAPGGNSYLFCMRFIFLLGTSLGICCHWLFPEDTALSLKSSGPNADTIPSVQLKSAGNVKEFTKR